MKWQKLKITLRKHKRYALLPESTVGQLLALVELEDGRIVDNELYVVVNDGERRFETDYTHYCVLPKLPAQ